MNSPQQEIFLYGAGGHAKVIIDIIEKEKKHKIAFIIDDRPQIKGSHILGYPIIGGIREFLLIQQKPSKAIISIGNNQNRKKIAKLLKKHDIEFPNAIHPRAVIAKEVFISSGTVVMANVAINSCTYIGKHVIINTGANIDHDCNIADYVHIAPGATLCGNINVGEGSLIGAGSTITPNVMIGKNVLIGAGTTIYKNVQDNSKVIGPRATL